MNIEGQLHIKLSLNERKCRQAKIISSRPLLATKIFRGKTPEEILKILPMLYNICGNAHAYAAETACLQAQGVVIPEGDTRKLAREMLVLIETAKEHLCRILLDWPGYIDECNHAEDMKAVLRLPTAFRQALFDKGIAFGEATTLQTDLDQMPTLIDQLDGLLQRLIFVRKPEEWFSIGNVSLLSEWIEQGETIASRLSIHLRQLAWENLGVTEIEFLPNLEESQLFTYFAAVDAEAFIAEPCWNNKTYETTSLSRQKNHPLIQALYKEHQNGLLTRIIARLLELAEVPSRLKKILTTIESVDSSFNNTQFNSDSGMGIGQVEAARGRLVHCVELERGIVKHYQILAPTEWNFHPLGVVARGLETLTTKNEILLRKQADLLINAIDPCVAYDITVH